MDEREKEAKFLAWKNRASANHPLYSTTNSAYGVVPRGCKFELKPPVAASSSEKAFSTSLGKATRRNTAMDTTIPKHRFLKEKDGYL